MKKISFAFIYTPYGAKFTLDKSIIKAKRVKEIWWDPRYDEIIQDLDIEPIRPF